MNDDFETQEMPVDVPSEGESIQQIYNILCNYRLRQDEKLYRIRQIVQKYLSEYAEPEIPNDVFNGRY